MLTVVDRPGAQRNPSANSRAALTSCIRTMGSVVMSAPSLPLATVWTWSRLTAQAWGTCRGGIKEVEWKPVNLFTTWRNRL